MAHQVTETEKEAITRRSLERASELHVYHHSESTPRITLNVERNSRSTTYSITVVGASSIDEAILLLREAKQKIEIEIATSAE